MKPVVVPHVYRTSGSSRDPYCLTCGEDSWDYKLCFPDRLALTTYEELSRSPKVSQ